jgi:hypothetical protein
MREPEPIVVSKGGASEDPAGPQQRGPDRVGAAHLTGVLGPDEAFSSTQGSLLHLALVFFAHGLVGHAGDLTVSPLRGLRNLPLHRASGSSS